FLLLPLVSVVLFVVLPLGAAWFGRVQPVAGLQLHRAGWPAFAGALLLGVSLWPFVLELLALLPRMNQELLAAIAQQMRQARADLPAWLVVGAFALIGVVEELFFRGYLFSALRTIQRPAAAIISTALLFGAYHLLSTPQQFVTGTLLGLGLGWLC